MEQHSVQIIQEVIIAGYLRLKAVYLRVQTVMNNKPVPSYLSPLGEEVMKTKFTILITILLLLALLLAGCGGEEPATSEAEAPANEAPEAEVPATEAPEAEVPTEEPEVEAPTAIEEAEAEAPEAAPSVLNVGTTYIWDTANPAFGWYGYTIRYMIYDTLVEEMGISDFQPGLAESWTVSDDGLVWTFKIREGVTFHDGTPCDANAVA
jgi:ABC-type transport system substrate-binding protein